MYVQHKELSHSVIHFQHGLVFAFPFSTTYSSTEGRLRIHQGVVREGRGDSRHLCPINSSHHQSASAPSVSVFLYGYHGVGQKVAELLGGPSLFVLWEESNHLEMVNVWSTFVRLLLVTLDLGEKAFPDLFGSILGFMNLI